MLTYNLYHVNGIKFELVDDGITDREYEVTFFDFEKSEVIYKTNLKKGQWAKINRQYISPIKVFVKYKDRIVTEVNTLQKFKNSRVFISFESKSLGDTLAWIPYCEEFRKQHNCELIVSTFHNYLFEKRYPEIKFVARGVVVNNIYAMIELGWFYDFNKEPVDPITIPLQKAASNILGIKEHTEILPKLDFTPIERPTSNKYVCISTKSTSGCKEWFYWQFVIDYLKSVEYEVFEVSYEETNFHGLSKVDDKSLTSVMNYIHHSEFFIGLSSGLSWLAWALQKKVFMISNFTESGHEFSTNCTRIINTSVCHGCWNNPKFKFNKGDWNWCPEHEDTPRHFECHQSIRPEKVISLISDYISGNVELV